MHSKLELCRFFAEVMQLCCVICSLIAPMHLPEDKTRQLWPSIGGKVIAPTLSFIHFSSICTRVHILHCMYIVHVFYVHCTRVHGTLYIFMCTDFISVMGEGHFGATVWAPPFRWRTFGRRFLILFLSYEEKTMKQAIPWIPFSANLFQLEPSILTRAKRATNRNNVAAKKQI